MTFRAIAFFLALLIAPAFAGQPSPSPQPVQYPLAVSNGGTGTHNGDTSNLTATVGGITKYLPAWLATMQSGSLLDSFKQSGDVDDTASLTRACAANVPIALGARTYVINSFVGCNGSYFTLRGIPGASIIQRQAAAAGSFFNINAANVDIEGVTFDMNSSAVSANQWGVFFSQGGQNIRLHNNVFKNNSGTLGACLVIASTGAAAGGSFDVSDSEITNCTWQGVFFGGVSNGVFARNYVHDVPTTNCVGVGTAISGPSYGYASGILITENRIARCNTGVAIGGAPQPYSVVNYLPYAQHITVSNNDILDVTGYFWSDEGQYDVFDGNHAHQSSTSQVTWGTDAYALSPTVINNDIEIIGINKDAAIDYGGCHNALIANNKIHISNGGGINMGGGINNVARNNHVVEDGTLPAITALNWASGTVTVTLASPVVFSTGTIIELYGQTPTAWVGYATVTAVSGNTFSFAMASNPGTATVLGTASYESLIGVTINEIEGDGTNTGIMPDKASGMVVENNTFVLIGPSALGVAVYDNAGGDMGAYPTIVKNNDFSATGAFSNTAQAIWFTGGPTAATIDGNTWNGQSYYYGDNQPDGDFILDPVMYGGTIVGLTNGYPIRAFTNRSTEQFNLLSIAYVTPLTSGSGYHGNTVTMSASGSGGGSGWTGTAAVYNGAIIGVKTITPGYGYSGTITVTATDTSGGAGATFQANTRYAIPQMATISYYAFGPQLMLNNGEGIAEIRPSIPIQMGNMSFLKLRIFSSGYFWGVESFTPATFASTSLPTCNSTASGAQINVTGSASGKWQAYCNGTAWKYPDGTTAP